jgi:Ran GTPase-activating protein (RanGAP) involved in mRNA processing and transport
MLTGEGIAPLCEVLCHDTQIQQLWLKRNPLRANGAEHIARALTQNRCLFVLDLVNTALLDEGLSTLLDALETNCTLAHCYLDGNGITVKALRG